MNLQVRELRADRTLHTLRALHLHVRELRADCFECLGGDRPDRKGAAVRDGTWEDGDLASTMITEIRLKSTQVSEGGRFQERSEGGSRAAGEGGERRCLNVT